MPPGTLPDPEALARLVADRPQTVDRMYRGMIRADAELHRNREQRIFRQLGYRITREEWAPGAWVGSAGLPLSLLYGPGPALKYHLGGSPPEVPSFFGDRPEELGALVVTYRRDPEP